MTNSKIHTIVLGGTGPSGSYLMRHMVNAGMVATMISRRPFTAPQGFTSIILDLNNPGEWQAPKGAIIISLLPIWLLAKFLPQLSGAKAVIATSSTSRFGKEGSSDANERATAAKLANGEETLVAWANKNNIAYTILRPTLIYDGNTDKNVTRMAKFIKRWRCLPIAWPSKGLRQPMHTDDVAKAVFKSINNPAAHNKAFNISGSEILTYREMAERVFLSLKMKPRFLLLPVPLLRQVFKFAAALGVVKESAFGAGIFQRMNEDLVFETADGLAALDYSPRAFNPDFSSWAA